MNPNLKWRALFVILVILLCFYSLLGRPSFPTSWAHLKQNFASRIKLGLDLQGGTHLILQVKLDDAIRQTTDQTIDRLRNDLAAQSIPFTEISEITDRQILVRGVPDAFTGPFRDRITGLYREWDLAAAAGEQGGFVLSLRSGTISAINQDTMRLSIETIDRRINALGLTEPTIAEYGAGSNDQILVQLPGESDPSRAKRVIQAGGQLELRLGRGGPYSSDVEARTAFGFVLPPGTELLPGTLESNTPGQPAQQVWYLVDRIPVVTGRDLRNAGYVRSTDHFPFYDVTFNLTSEAAPRFGRFTQDHIGQPLTIVLDGRVQSSATIQGRIDDSGRITGQFSLEAAKDLALILRAGALPASIAYLQESTIGPSLGADSIRQGFQASILSLLVVMLFMLFYYKKAGINADLALILNLIILMAVLGVAGASLTLPGIAGVILTVGMGVDSNVLIFERIREELRNGKAPASAVDLGFTRAFLTIIDTHVTTVVSCAFLWMFGTGPVRGFAVTLVIGLISNLFTAVYVSRTIFNWHLARMPRQQQLSI